MVRIVAQRVRVPVNPPRDGERNVRSLDRSGVTGVVLAVRNA
jgi:hypothetical protein